MITTSNRARRQGIRSCLAAVALLCSALAAADAIAQQPLPGAPEQAGRDSEVKADDAAVNSDATADPYRGGSFSFGYFVIDNINSRVYFGPEEVPLSVRVDLSRDLGLKDSLNVLRLGFLYRFGSRHGISLGYYDMDNSGIRDLSRTIELGDEEFQLGTPIRSSYEEKILKFGYNLVFHDEGKVLLAVTAGLHLTSIDFKVRSQEPSFSAQREEGGSATAPLPMLGGRMRYRITPKLSMDVQSDIFFLNRGDQQGSLTDTYLSFEHQTFDRIAFGAGVNRWALDIDFTDNGERWDWQSVYTGAYLYFRVSF